MKVFLIANTPEPLRVIAAQQLIRKGDDVSDLLLITDEQAESLFLDVLKTNLRGSLEFVDFLFLISGVTRAFTHQIVRHRAGCSFSQESLRFSPKEEFEYYTGPTINEDFECSRIYSRCMSQINFAYKDLLRRGVAMEDARGLLPTNVCTQISVKINYRSLYEMAQVRLCRQTQKEFRDVVLLMKEAINRICPIMADRLQPICVNSGVCEYGSMFDRECVLQKRYPVRKIQ